MNFEIVGTNNTIYYNVACAYQLPLCCPIVRMVGYIVLFDKCTYIIPMLKHATYYLPKLYYPEF